MPFDTMTRKLAYFVSERESVRMKKLSDPAQTEPWTEDEILQKYRFCNVHRADDRVSRWIIENIIEPYNDNDWLWIMLACARYINWPPTIIELIERGEWPVASFSPTAFGGVIDRRAEKGKKAWTGAYVITGRNIPPGMSKGVFVAKSMLEPLFHNVEIPKYLNTTAPEERSVQAVLKMFEGIYGWGTFMSGQVVADMTYCHLLSEAKDLKTFAPIGPGSTRGLNRIYGRSLEQSIPQERFNDELMETLETCKPVADINLNSLTLHDWQNCMCEFDKYIRATNGGRPRSNYIPETAY